MMLIFFFSSRRRHTRCSRDWSSDVCSSDLLQGLHAALLAGGFLERGLERSRLRMQLIGDLRWQHGHNHRHRRLDFDADSLAIMVRLEAAIYLQEGRQLVFFFYLVHPPKLWLDAVLDAIPVVVVDVQVIGSLETARRRALGCKDSRDAYADGALGFVVRVQDGAEAGKQDRKSTRLNSSHGYISYAVF